MTVAPLLFDECEDGLVNNRSNLSFYTVKVVRLTTNNIRHFLHGHYRRYPSRQSSQTIASGAEQLWLDQSQQFYPFAQVSLLEVDKLDHHPASRLSLAGL